MAKFNQLFDFQKIADNEELSEVINETHSRYGNIVELRDEDLELASAGKGGNYNETRICGICKMPFKIEGDFDAFVCPACKEKNYL